MRIAFFLFVLAPVISGCSKAPAPGFASVKASGDITAFVLQCATNRGAHVPTVTLPSIQAEWTHQSRPMEDIIQTSGDHFSELKSALEQAYGKPDPALGSSIQRPAGGGEWVMYSPQQVGVALGLTGAGVPKQTIITILGKPKP